MTRFALILSLIVAACDVGDVTMGMGGGGGGGGGGGADAGGGSGSAEFAVCADPGTAGLPHQHIAGGTSNAGQDCLAAGCHNLAVPGAGAPPWSAAGTVYTTAGGPTPAGAVIVRVLDANGVLLQSVADQDGNFYVFTQAGIAFPAQTDVTSCPTLTPMATTIISTSQGGCNSCHATPEPSGGAPPLGLM